MIRDPGWTIRIIFFRAYKPFFFAFLGVKILKFFDEDPGSGMETVRIRDPGWKKVGSGIRDKHPGSATLVGTAQYIYASTYVTELSYILVRGGGVVI